MVIVVDTAANRLKRIKEVREQEKSISRLQVCKYRSEIISSKQNRFQRSKESKIFELEEKQQNLILQWQRALLENGNGHYLSEHSSPDDHGLKFQRNVNERERFRKALLMERSKRINNMHAELERKKRITTKQDFQKNEREDAHAFGEKYFALMNVANESESDRSIVKKFKVVDQSTDETIINRNRKNVPVNATIIKHFSLKGYEEVQEVKNNVVEATEGIYRRMWGAVMQELLNRRTRTVRGRKAVQQVLTTSSRSNGLARLEHQLYMLEAADNLRRRKIPSSSSASVDRRKVMDDIQLDFEEQFLSSPWISTPGPLPRPFVTRENSAGDDLGSAFSIAAIDEVNTSSEMPDPRSPLRKDAVINLSNFPRQPFLPMRGFDPSEETLTQAPSSPSTNDELSSKDSSVIYPEEIKAHSHVRSVSNDSSDQLPATERSRPMPAAIPRINVPTVKADNSMDVNRKGSLISSRMKDFQNNDLSIINGKIPLRKANYLAEDKIVDYQKAMDRNVRSEVPAMEEDDAGFDAGAKHAWNQKDNVKKGANKSVLSNIVQPTNIVKEAQFIQSKRRGIPYKKKKSTDASKRLGSLSSTHATTAEAAVAAHEFASTLVDEAARPLLGTTLPKRPALIRAAFTSGAQKVPIVEADSRIKHQHENANASIKSKANQNQIQGPIADLRQYEQKRPQSETNRKQKAFEAVVETRSHSDMSQTLHARANHSPAIRSKLNDSNPESLPSASRSSTSEDLELGGTSQKSGENNLEFENLEGATHSSKDAEIASDISSKSVQDYQTDRTSTQVKTARLISSQYQSRNFSSTDEENIKREDFSNLVQPRRDSRLNSEVDEQPSQSQKPAASRKFSNESTSYHNSYAVKKPPIKIDDKAAGYYPGHYMQEPLPANLSLSDRFSSSQDSVAETEVAIQYSTSLKSQPAFDRTGSISAHHVNESALVARRQPVRGNNYDIDEHFVQDNPMRKDKSDPINKLAAIPGQDRAELKYNSFERYERNYPMSNNTPPSTSERYEYQGYHSSDAFISQNSYTRKIIAKVPTDVSALDRLADVRSRNADSNWFNHSTAPAAGNESNSADLDLSGSSSASFFDYENFFDDATRTAKNSYRLRKDSSESASNRIILDKSKSLSNTSFSHISNSENTNSSNTSGMHENGEFRGQYSQQKTPITHEKYSFTPDTIRADRNPQLLSAGNSGNASGSFSSETSSNDRLTQLLQSTKILRLDARSKTDENFDSSLISNSHSVPVPVSERVSPELNQFSVFSSVNNTIDGRSSANAVSQTSHKSSVQLTTPISASILSVSHSSSSNASKSTDELSSSSGESDSTAELYRQWVALYNRNRKTEQRVIDEKAMSVDAQVIESLKVIHPPKPPFKLEAGPFNNQSAESSRLSSPLIASIPDAFEENNFGKAKSTLVEDPTSKMLRMNSSEILMNPSVRDSMLSISSSAESSLYQQWDQLYKVRATTSSALSKKPTRFGQSMPFNTAEGSNKGTAVKSTESYLSSSDQSVLSGDLTGFVFSVSSQDFPSHSAALSAASDLSSSQKPREKSVLNFVSDDSGTKSSLVGHGEVTDNFSIIQNVIEQRNLSQFSSTSSTTSQTDLLQHWQDLYSSRGHFDAASSLILSTKSQDLNRPTEVINSRDIRERNVPRAIGIFDSDRHDNFMDFRAVEKHFNLTVTSSPGIANNERGRVNTASTESQANDSVIVEDVTNEQKPAKHSFDVFPARRFVRIDNEISNADSTQSAAASKHGWHFDDSFFSNSSENNSYETTLSEALQLSSSIFTADSEKRPVNYQASGDRIAEPNIAQNSEKKSAVKNENASEISLRTFRSSRSIENTTTAAAQQIPLPTGEFRSNNRKTNESDAFYINQSIMDISRSGGGSSSSFFIERNPTAGQLHSISEALIQLPLQLQEKLATSQTSLVPSDLSSDISDAEFEIDLGESSESLSHSLNSRQIDITEATKNFVQMNSLDSASSSSSIEIGLYWDNAVKSRGSSEGSLHSDRPIAQFENDAAEIQSTLFDMRRKLLASLPAVNTSSPSIRDVTTFTVPEPKPEPESEALLDPEAESKPGLLAERSFSSTAGGAKQSASESYVRYSSYLPTSTNLVRESASRSSAFPDSSAMEAAGNSSDFDLLVDLGISGLSQSNGSSSSSSSSSSNIGNSSSREHPSAVVDHSFTSEDPSKKREFGEDARSTQSYYSYLGAVKNTAQRYPDNLDLESSYFNSASEDRSRSRATTNNSMSGSISNLSNYPLRGSPAVPSPSLQQSPSLFMNSSADSNLAVPIDSIHSEEEGVLHVNIAQGPVRM